MARTEASRGLSPARAISVFFYRHQRHLFVVAAQAQLGAIQKRAVVQTRIARQGARFQLAQRDRLLVVRAAFHRRALGGGDFISLGQQPCLSRGWRSAASAARPAAPPKANAGQQRGGAERNNAEAALTGLDQLWARAEQQASGWQSISLRLPNSPDAPATFTIDHGDGGQPQNARSLRWIENR